MHTSLRALFLSALLIISTLASFAQIERAVSFRTYLEPAGPVKVGSTVTVFVEATIDKGYHIYSARQVPDMEMLAALFELDDQASGVQLAGKLDDRGKRETAFDDIFGADISLFHDKATFVQKIKVTSANPSLKAFLRYQTCDDSKCIPGTLEISLPIAIAAAAPANPASTPGATPAVEPVPATNGAALTPSDTTSTAGTAEAAPSATESAVKVAATTEAEPVETENLWIKFLKGLALGLGSVLTPCVFPMIPLTVSIFTKLNDKPGSGVRNGLFYGFSIVFIFTVLGILISAIFGPDALRRLAVHPATNLFIFGAIFVFALSFLGWFEIALPSSWSTALSQKSQRGGWMGIFLMALTLVVVSFSCTGPLVFTALFDASSGTSFFSPVVSMLGFSSALAAPFVLFSIFPNWLQGLPRSGGWLNEVKVTLGLLELALALIYLSRADLVMHWGILDREIFLGAWIVITAVLGFYLLGKIRMKSDSPVERLTTPRLLMAMSVFWFTLYLVPGLWGAPLKMLGGYLPEVNDEMGVLALGGQSVGSGGTVVAEGEICDYPDKVSGHLSEHTPRGFCAFYDLEQGLEYARKVNKPVFLDFTGHTCANCRYLENNMWIDPQIRRMITEEYVLVSLYTDDRVKLPEPELTLDGKKLRKVGDKWIHYEQTEFNQNAQPYYVLMGHNKEVLVPPTGFNPPLDLQQYRDYFASGLKAFSEKKQATR